MRNKILFSQLLAYFSLLITLFTQAEQLEFTKQQQADKLAFHYLWIDQFEQTQTLDFQLAKQDVFNRFRNFKAYKAKFADSYVQKQLKKALTETPIPDVQVRFTKVADTFQLTVRGRDKEKVSQAEQQIAELQQQYFDEYLANNFYQKLVMPNNVSGIVPAHAAIARASVDDLKEIKAIILEQVSIRNIRKVTNFVLSFVQSIPYADLASRTTASGTGFSTPLNLLYENQGDCDSKMTLTIAILRSLMPRIKLALVYIDHHALMGIDIPPLAGELTLTQDNTTFVLAEPTGPARYPLGTVDPMSEQAILNNLYLAEIFGE
jgi:hypothetical protein